MKSNNSIKKPFIVELNVALATKRGYFISTNISCTFKHNLKYETTIPVMKLQASVQVGGTSIKPAALAYSSYQSATLSQLVHSTAA